MANCLLGFMGNPNSHLASARCTWAIDKRCSDQSGIRLLSHRPVGIKKKAGAMSHFSDLIRMDLLGFG